MENTPNNGIRTPYDPGWNDPPKFSYNAQQTTPGRPRNFLNKRVAFPLSSGGTSPAQAPPVNLPPMPSTLPLIPSMPTSQAVSSETSTDVDSHSTLEEVKSILLEFLDNSSELGPKSNEIKRRLSVMEDMWTSAKLNNSIYVQMKELALALRNDEPSKADDIHRSLMVDHVSAVGTWMPGVKHLIHHSIAKSELLSIDKE